VDGDVCPAERRLDESVSITGGAIELEAISSSEPVGALDGDVPPEGDRDRGGTVASDDAVGESTEAVLI